MLTGYYTPIVRKAGLSYIRFHDLRHTAAMLMLLQGIHPKIISEILGYASVAIMPSLYSHVLDMQQCSAWMRCSPDLPHEHRADHHQRVVAVSDPVAVNVAANTFAARQIERAQYG